MELPNNTDVMERYLKIFKEDIADVDKMLKAFQLVTDQFIEHEEHYIELARMVDDKEKLITSQVKMGVMKHARGILHDCYYRTTGKLVKDD